MRRHCSTLPGLTSWFHPLSDLIWATINQSLNHPYHKAQLILYKANFLWLVCFYSMHQNNDNSKKNKNYFHTMNEKQWVMWGRKAGMPHWKTYTDSSVHTAQGSGLRESHGTGLARNGITQLNPCQMYNVHTVYHHSHSLLQEEPKAMQWPTVLPLSISYLHATTTLFTDQDQYLH